jgi:tellurite resistance protein
MDADTFGGLVVAAVAVAYADGMIENNENRVMTDAILEITGGHFSFVDIQALIQGAFDQVVKVGVEASITRAAKMIQDEPTRAVAMIFAAAVAWSGRGVSDVEAARLKQLARELKLEARYDELYAAGKELAQH